MGTGEGPALSGTSEAGFYLRCGEDGGKQKTRKQGTPEMVVGQWCGARLGGREIRCCMFGAAVGSVGMLVWLAC